MGDDELMTRREARQRDAVDECQRDGHDLDVSQARSFSGDVVPVGLRCARCGASWGIAGTHLPYVIQCGGTEVFRTVDVDDGLDPQYEGMVHDLALALSSSYDGLVTVIDDRLAEEHAQVAAFEGGKASF